jgi:hypothetical protein
MGQNKLSCTKCGTPKLNTVWDTDEDDLCETCFIAQHKDGTKYIYGEGQFYWKSKD